MCPPATSKTPVDPRTATIRGQQCPTSRVAVMTQSRGTGTSNSCSTICGTGSTARCKIMSWEVILGTTTCSGTTVSMCLNTSTSWPTISDTGTSSIGALRASTSCSVHSLLRPELEEPVGPRPAGLFSGEWADRRRTVHLAPPLPGSGILLSL